MVVGDEGVVGRYVDIELAKEKLKSTKEGARLIAEVDSANIIQRDPHWVGGQQQTQSQGFNKFWRDWNDIKRLLDIAQKYLDNKPTGNEHYIKSKFFFQHSKFCNIFVQ